MTPVFVSYHHRNDQSYKDYLTRMNERHRFFEDYSVNTDEISDELSDEAIRCKIRDEYLRDSTVTIVLVGRETQRRKHVDWEIYSSMFDGRVNKKSGILVINLPTTGSDLYTAAHANEKQVLYPENSEWVSVEDRAEYERRYPFMPARIIDNLLSGGALISVVPWFKIQEDFTRLKFLVDATHRDRSLAEYDLSRPLRRYNS